MHRVVRRTHTARTSRLLLHISRPLPLRCPCAAPLHPAPSSANAPPAAGSAFAARPSCAAHTPAPTGPGPLRRCRVRLRPRLPPPQHRPPPFAPSALLAARCLLPANASYCCCAPRPLSQSVDLLGFVSPGSLASRTTTSSFQVAPQIAPQIYRRSPAAPASFLSALLPRPLRLLRLASRRAVALWELCSCSANTPTAAPLAIGPPRALRRAPPAAHSPPN